MYIWGELILLSLKPFGRFPVTLQSLNYGQLLLFFFFFPSLSQNVRNKHFNSKWHCDALQRCSPGPFPRQPLVLCPAARCAAGAQPFGERSHTGKVPKHCSTRPSSAILELVYTFKTHKKDIV